MRQDSNGSIGYQRCADLMEVAMWHQTILGSRFATLRNADDGPVGGGVGVKGDAAWNANRRGTDDELATVIATRLASADDADTDRVHVAVQRAWVTLQGEVPNRRSLGSIEALVASCDGVVRIVNRMRVGYSH
ncbi:BON domain-containing protein [Robbsia andropogonis]|uniref:BON domain-containing protein n=1 Tax=Robbsia andropogonis TaxID=28092 RepID=UPI002A6A747E|nr:BON domain-containing protein [Robbsia andropogonis]